MTEHEATRTLVKSPPELWTECSNADSLARHLDGFGDIRITRLEPETTVAWEGECASGTVRLEPSGWGTRVTLTARQGLSTAEPATRSSGEAEPGLPAGLAVKRRGRLLARLFGVISGREAGPSAGSRPRAEADDAAEDARATAPPGSSEGKQALSSALASLGQAHHRPFSRG